MNLKEYMFYHRGKNQLYLTSLQVNKIAPTMSKVKQYISSIVSYVRRSRTLGKLAHFHLCRMS